MASSLQTRTQVQWLDLEKQSVTMVKCKPFISNKNKLRKKIEITCAKADFARIVLSN